MTADKWLACLFGPIGSFLVALLIFLVAGLIVDPEGLEKWLKDIDKYWENKSK